VSVADRDKRAMVFPIRRLADLGFEILATAGTADVLRRHGIATTVVRKHFEGGETVIDLILDGRIDMIVNTPYGNSGPRIDGYEIRSAAVARGIPCITTVQAAAAAVQGIEALSDGTGIGVRSLQDMHAALRKAALRRLRG
jgi:carbamoyl-phosphate synthase large subunit